MKISFKKTLAKMLCLTMGVSSMAAPLIGCGQKSTTPVLLLATDALDTVFNPFFYTSGPDGEIVGQTQIGMLSSDKNGQLIANWNEPCVAFEWSYVKHGDPSMVQGNDYGDYYTDYYFALKDNIKFSDGVLLTKDDVLFNMYMYLDPAYTGSNTMYSVKIDGLTEYRTQTADLDNAAGADQYFQNKVEGRLKKILAWVEDEDAPWGDAGFSQYEYYPGEKTLESDIKRIQEYYKTSLSETWTSVISADIEKEYEKYKGSDGKLLITEPYQLFLYYYGIVNLREHRVSTSTGSVVDYYEYENNFPQKDIPNKKDDRKSNKFRDTLINYVYNGKFDATEQANATNGFRQNLYDVMNSYPVNAYMEEYLLSDVKYREFKNNMQVKSIRGITVEKQDTIKVVDENTGNVVEKPLKDAAGNPKSYYVLHVKIKGVDPKAQQNFAFTVAPGHYYSTKEEWAKATGDNDKDNEFFGVKFSDPSFMDSVRVKQLPLGAGPYRAAKSTGGVATKKSDFFGSNNIVNFEANPNFLLGKPKIKKLRYKVISSSQLYNAVKKGEVDYASPSMKREEITQLAKDAGKLSSESADNLGYGYIGISARYIPNIYIRKAIMTTLDSQMCIDSYYGGEGGSVITRPMSKTLEGYYLDWDAYYEFDDTGAKAKEFLEDGGCRYENGVYLDETGKKMKYTFTIAGDSDDHPANYMLLRSAEILNDLGLEITVTHDSMALSKLSSGLLTVWAAAWSSSSDPDMFQVYHKNSQATSTTAWGYKYIFSSQFQELEPKNNKLGYDQRKMIDELSALIDDGRETDVKEERIEIYDQAMDKLMDLAVEFPTYQRKVFYIWRKGVFKEKTMLRGTGNVTTYQSPLSRIWEVELAK
ncbi:MAG: hypothetical protein J1F69_01820 [Clostridiales bacterium]|nr:hypothetical protein [Clostridiales bacterium]